MAIPSVSQPRGAVDDDCVITRLEKATMIATIHNEPEFSELFMSYLLTRNSRIEEDLIDQLFNVLSNTTENSKSIVPCSTWFCTRSPRSKRGMKQSVRNKFCNVSNLINPSPRNQLGFTAQASG